MRSLQDKNYGTGPVGGFPPIFSHKLEKMGSLPPPPPVLFMIL